MSGVYPIPPSRDLPPGRLAQRREHLLAEIVRERDSHRAHAPMRLRWTRRRKVVALAAAALVVAVGTASAIGSVREFILDRGFVGLPPQGATPSAPESGAVGLLELLAVDHVFLCAGREKEPRGYVASAPVAVAQHARRGTMREPPPASKSGPPYSGSQMK